MNIIKSTAKVVVFLLASTALVSTAYAVKPHGITMINESGQDLTLHYTNAPGTVLPQQMASGYSFNLTDFIGNTNVPKKVELQIFPTGALPGDDTNFCFNNGDDYYTDPFTGDVKEYPALDSTGAYVPYTPGMTEQQPFIQTSDSVMAFSANLLTQLGTIVIKNKSQCIFNNLSPAHKNSAITAYPATATGILNQPFSFDFANMFDDKVPNPGSPTSGLLVSLISSMPAGFAWDKAPTTQISTSSLVGDNKTVLACACDPKLSKDSLAPGEAGACVDDQPSCTSPQPAGALSWVDPVSGSIASTLQIDVLSGVFAKTPDEIAAAYTPLGKHKIGGSQQTLLTTQIQNAASQAVITIPVASLFKISSTLLPVTYSVVSSTDQILGRNDGDSPSTVTPAHNVGGANWGPIVLQNTVTNHNPIVHLATGLTIQNTSSMLQINMNDAAIKSAMDSAAATANGGIIIQATIHAATTDSSVSNKDAYQTIYIMLDKGSAQVNLLKQRVQAWAYAPTVAALTDGGSKPTPSAKCTLDGSAGSYAPLSDYLSVINNSQSNDHGLTEITPDIGWIQFNGVSKHWPTVGDVFSNNATTNPYIGCFASYFKNHVTLANDNAKLGFSFIVTMEFDGNLKGYTPNLIDEAGSADPSSTGTSLSQVALLSQAVLQAANPEKVFPNAGITSPNGSPVVNGIQFDVEPLPISGMATTFYKRVADLLARQGKVNQLFAFAGSDSSGVIMAQGPLGIFLPSAYDVGQTANPTFNAIHGAVSDPNKAFWGKLNGNEAYTKSPKTSGAFPYPASFQGITSPSPSPLDAKDFTNDKAMDYGCHWAQNLDGTGKDAYLIKSYCNYDLTNSVYNNAIRFNGAGKDHNQDFEQRNRTFLGHYSLSVPAEASATAWNYQIIYNPRLENASGACDTSKADPCVIASLANTYTPIYVGLDYYRTETYGTTSPASDWSEYGQVTNFINSHTPAFGHYYVFYSTTSPTAKLPDSPGTPAAPIIGDTTPKCSMSLADAASDSPPTMCDVIVTWHNNGKADDDPDLSTSNFTDSLLTASLQDSNPHTQGNYTQAIFDMANTVAKSPTDAQKLLLLNNPLRTPFDNSDHNIGVAMYALSDESVSGCQPNGSHGDNPNCFDAYPIGFPPVDAAGQATTGIWHAINRYMDGTTGYINGGGKPGPVPTPGSISVIPSFISNSEETFTISKLPTGQTCTLQVTNPDNSTTTPVSIVEGKTATLTGLANPVTFAVSHPDESYLWTVQCTDLTNSGKFHRYGDSIEMWLANSAGAKSTETINMTEAGKNTAQTWKNIPTGSYTVDFAPRSVNDTRSTTTDHNTLLTPTLASPTVVVSKNADTAVQLSFKQ